ncbi:DUF1769-domain-containing protein [Microthyrium microscopicum]|uniref:DUF1769-domain-containing protein n=1 Tax=Microthyrium microscopicum TaxID=703497 RepID=A0A6A6U9N9_9PEZI|nr:DUF1769-domain-containing protein [Microthyrium microscopicum]
MKYKSSKYLLRITCGPSYDPSTHIPILPNCDTPTAIENEHIKAHIKVRVRNYTGLPLHAPSTSPYFSAPSRSGTQYSVGFSFVPKHDIRGDEATWGNDFDHPVRDRLPPGFNIAVKIVKEFVDPSIELDAYADQPWLYAPALTSFFAMRVGEKKGAEEWGAAKELPDVEENAPIEEGADGSGQQIREQLKLPDTVSKRKKHFRSKENQAAFTFEEGRLYQADFFNPYIDFGDFSLKLPGFSINCIKYIGDKTHTLRYVFKNNKTNEVYFCVVFTLLHGDELQDAIKDEAERWKMAEEEAAQGGLKPAGSAESLASAKEALPKDRPAVEVEEAYVEHPMGKV